MNKLTKVIMRSEVEELRIRDYSKAKDGSIFMIDVKLNGIHREGVTISRDELKEVFEYCKKVFGEKTDEEIYREKLKAYTKQDVLAQLAENPNVTDDMDVDAIADKVAEMYAENGDYDCNLSYWGNIDNLIYEVLLENRRAVS
jgi:hypothetical protein